MFYDESKQQRYRRKIQFAKTLRQKMTESEAFLWKFLRNRKCEGMKFRRQVPMGWFIADFLCRKHKLIIEIDGNVHKDMGLYDEERDKTCRAHGYHVLRFTDQRILNDIHSVLQTILQHCEVPSPCGQRGGMGEGKKG